MMVGPSTAVAVAIAERIESVGGPRAGLAAWRALASRSLTPEVLAKALLAAFRCALAVRDFAAVDDLTRRWSSVAGGVWDRAIVSLCKSLARAGELQRATALAEAEAGRHPTVLALYCYARCLDVERNHRAVVVFGDVVRRARKEGAGEIELAARVRRITLLSQSWRTMGDALDEAAGLDLASAPIESLVPIARVLLRSPSRFTRSTALGLLDRVVVAADPQMARRALAVVARWVDDLDAISPIEEDRLLAALGRAEVVAMAPRLRDVVRVVLDVVKAGDERSLSRAMDEGARLAPELALVHARARDVLSGRFEVSRDIVAEVPADAAQRRAVRYGQVLDLVVALRDGGVDRAARLLDLLGDAEVRGEPVPAVVLWLARSSLERGDRALRDVASRFVDARLCRMRRSGIEGGYLLVADTLAGVGMRELAGLAYRAALVGREAGAAASLEVFLVREGWKLASEGKRQDAIATLREGKAVIEASTK